MKKETKLSYLLFVLFIIFAGIHNLIGAFWGFQEPFFFLFALISAFLFVVSVLANVAKYMIVGRPNDLWKLGFLGLLGILGMFLKPGFFGLFGFFGFFGLRKHRAHDEE